MTESSKTYAERLTRRAQREREIGVTCYDYQAMLEVDHPDWQRYSAAFQQLDADGIGYTPAESELAIKLINVWIREAGVKQVRETITDIIAHRAKLTAEAA